MGAGLVVFLVSAYGMDRFRFTPTSVLVFRIAAYAGLAALVVRFLVIPLTRRLSAERVALYLEEHEPSLEARLLSAIEFSGSGGGAAESYSPDLVRRLVESAVESCAAVQFGRRVEAKPLARSSGWLAGTTLAAMAMFLLSPSFVRHSTPFLLPLGGASGENPYRIEVEPGNALVARGSELGIEARLSGFDSERVEIAVNRGGADDWERTPMTQDEDTGGYLFYLFDLDEETEYFVEASGVRSSLFRVEVAELPYVDELVLEYHFPAYTGLTPQRQEDGGDIVAVWGTEVKFFITPTVGVAGGGIVLDERDSIPLVQGEDGLWTADLTVEREAQYRIVFESLAGDLVVGSPDYLIDVLTDQPPVVSFSKPGRDIKVTNIEEVFVEVEAEDDYGVRRIELMYSVNGGEESRLQLYSSRSPQKNISAGHTFYLEELELQPGDFISYYARASDDNRVSGRQATTTDIYFMEVRPFDREFRQADQSGGGGGGAGFDSSLSQRQRDIIAATFKMVRDRQRYSDKEYRENLATLALAQGRLREQVEGLVSRIRARGILQMDSSFQTVAEALPKAAEEMAAAEERLGERDAAEALPPEQRALQQLQRAEAAFREVQVGRSESGGGGGQANVEELAELFELELDKQRNQYERVERSRQQQIDEQLDETLQKLQELARRQQQENERARARAREGQSQGGGGSQRQLAEQAEELARRLERLAREESLPDLNRTARQLREAAEEMRRAAANARTGDVSEGLSALERIKEARRLLDRNRSAGLKRDVDEALQRAERLAEAQRDIVSEVERLGGETGTDRRERVRRLNERKDEMAAEVADLETQLHRLSRESSREQRDASRGLKEAANTIRDGKLEDKIRYSRGVIAQRSPEYARNFEEQIAQDLEGLREQIEAARDAIGETRDQRLSQALDRARDLTRSLESLNERIRSRADDTSERDRAAESQAEAGERAEPSGEPGQPSEQGGQQPAESGQQPGSQEGAPTRGAETDTRDGFPGFNAGDVRQFRREFRERRAEAEELRRQLGREGVDASELNAIIDKIRQLERDRPYGDPRGLADLQAQVIQGLKEFEYLLRRQLGEADARELLLTGSDEVPEGYRELVEEYYRALAGEGSKRP